MAAETSSAGTDAFRYWTAFALLAILSSSLFLLHRFPPLVDLPQHAALTRLWMDLDAGDAWAQQRYELNLFTPYLTGYFCMRLLATWFGVLAAAKITVALALLAYPLALRSLLRSLDADPWWSLSGFALALNTAFYWGFVNYLIALPLSFYVLALGLRVLRQSSARRALTLAVLLIVLFMTHAIAFFFVQFLLFSWLAVCFLRDLRQRFRERVAFLAALVPGALVAVAWWKMETRNVVSGARVINWDLSRDRFLEMFASHISVADDRAAALVLIVIVLVWLRLAGPRLQRRLVAWIPLTVTAAFAFLGPASLSKVFFAQRAAVLVLPTSLMVLRTPSDPRRRALLRTLTVLCAAGWLIYLHLPFREFNRGSDEFLNAARRVPPQTSHFTIVYDHELPFLSVNPYVHFGAWVQVLRSGEIPLSFARFDQEIVRYRAGHRKLFGHGVEFWHPHELRFAPVARADHFLVRTRPGELPAEFLERAGTDVAVVWKGARWTVFRHAAGRDDT